MMWFFRRFLIFISYHIFLLNQVEGAIAIPPSNSAPLPLFCPSVCPSVCPSIGLLTTFSGFCTFADKSLGRNGIELEMQMFPDDLPLANIDADGYCCHFMRLSVRPTIHGLGFFIAYKVLGRNGLQFGMLMYPDGLHILQWPRCNICRYCIAWLSTVSSSTHKVRPQRWPLCNF